MDYEGDGKYHPNRHGTNRQKFAVENVGRPGTGNAYVEEDDDSDDDNEVEDAENIDSEEDDEDDDDDDGGNGVLRIRHDDYEYGNEDDDDDSGDAQKHLKKRKIKTLLSNYEFAPRVPKPLSVAASAPKPSSIGRNPLTDWTERETFILLDAWGDRVMKREKKGLRSKEWQEVVEKVNLVSKVERTNTQCRNRLDTLKKKYKKEKMKVGEHVGSASDWVHFKKMDMLLSSHPHGSGLSCGMDSGGYALMNPKVSLNRVNGVGKMSDSPGNSEVPSKRTNNRQVRGIAASLKMLADSVNKFSKIYEKIEHSKMQQMLELEKMRMDFFKDLELHKNQILERAQAEMVKIPQGSG